VNCDAIHPLLLAYHDRRLAPERIDEVEHHLAGCARCHGLVRHWSRADDLTRIAGATPKRSGWADFRAAVLASTVHGTELQAGPAPFRLGRVRLNWFAAGLAAAAVLAAAVGLGRHLLWTDPAPIDGPEITKIDGRPTDRALTVPDRMEPPARLLRSADLLSPLSLAPEPTREAHLPLATADTIARIGRDEALPQSEPQRRPHADPTAPPAVATLPVDEALARGVGSAEPKTALPADPALHARQMESALVSAGFHLHRVESINPGDEREFKAVCDLIDNHRLIELLVELERHPATTPLMREKLAGLSAAFLKFTLSDGDFRSQDVAAVQDRIRRRAVVAAAAAREGRRWLGELASAVKR